MDRSWVVLTVLIAALTTLAAAGFQYDLSWLPTLASNFPASFGFNVKPYATTLSNTSEEWNLLHHLGGNGPWIPKTTDVVEGGIDPPPGCRIDQIHMVGSHLSTCIEPSTKLSIIRYLDMPNATRPSRLA